MKTPFYRDVICKKVMGGKRPLWQAHHFEIENLCGAGKNAELAILDLQKQVRFVKMRARSLTHSQSPATND